MNHGADKRSLLREEQILELIPVSKSTFRRWIQNGHFPQGIKLTERIRVWPSEVVHAWIENFLHSARQ